MKRREFSLSAASAVAASALTLPVANPAMAQARQFKEGKDFKRLDKPVAPDAPAGKVDVIEFFWYSCPHCHAFEPTLDAWVKAAPKDLSIRRVPVAFNASFVPQQKLFYALEGMGKLDAVHAKVFRAIHVEKAKLAKDDEIFAWVAQQGGTLPAQDVLIAAHALQTDATVLTLDAHFQKIPGLRAIDRLPSI